MSKLSKRRIAKIDEEIAYKIDKSVLEEIKDRSHRRTEDRREPKNLNESDIWRNYWISSEG